MGEHHVLVQGNGPLFGDDNVGLPAHGVEPVTKFFRVRNSGAERNQLHPGGEVNDDLFPHGSAESIGQVVNFVHDHIAQVLQQCATRIEHVAQHFGGHDDYPSTRVDTGVSGEEPNF